MLVPVGGADGLFLFCCVDELPAPTAHEEKVKGRQSCGGKRLLPLCFPSSASFSFTAEAAGDRESRKMAEDGEEVGKIQEQ